MGAGDCARECGGLHPGSAVDCIPGVQGTAPRSNTCPRGRPRDTTLSPCEAFLRRGKLLPSLFLDRLLEPRSHADMVWLIAVFLMAHGLDRDPLAPGQPLDMCDRPAASVAPVQQYPHS